MGQIRMECYLAKLIAAVKSAWGGGSHDWRDELIDSGEHDEPQSLEEALAAFNSNF